MVPLPGGTSTGVCERCEGTGSYLELAPCTTFGPDCACNGPMVSVECRCAITPDGGGWSEDRSAWRCEDPKCRCVNHAHEAFCYLCGGGQPDDEETDG